MPFAIRLAQAPPTVGGAVRSERPAPHTRPMRRTRVFVARANQDEVVGEQLSVIGRNAVNWELLSIPKRPYWKLLAWLAIAQCDLFVFVRTSASVASKHCLWERGVARRHGVPVLELSPDQVSDLPELLLHRSTWR